MNFLGVQRPIDTVNSQTIFSVGGFPINNTTISIALLALLLLFFYVIVIRKFVMQPGKMQIVVETIYQQVETFLFRITSSKKKARDLVPVIGSVFVFILLSNWLAVLPVLGSITFDNKSLFRAPTADYSTTFSLALGCLIIIHFESIKHFGILGYISRFFKFKDVYIGFRKSIGEGMLSIIHFFIGILDIISEFARLVSVSLRLFGNIYAAGMVLGTVMTGIIAYFVPAIFTGLGLLFGAVQAVVFSSLITIFYMLSLPESSPEAIEHEGEITV